MSDLCKQFVAKKRTTIGSLPPGAEYGIQHRTVLVLFFLDVRSIYDDEGARRQLCVMEKSNSKQAKQTETERASANKEGRRPTHVHVILAAPRDMI